MTGRTISHYKILERLGKGGMGEVWKAEDTQLRRTVALKFLSSDAIDNEEIKARLIREAQASAALDHPNICHVYGIHEENGETFIAMAYIDGPSLAEKIKERPLPLDEALNIAIQIAEGLQEAHEKGIVHRDIKPHNVMLTAKGQVKIMDFGLASLAGRSKLTKSGTTLGTPAYMAPEQLEGRDVDRRADIWALGCVLFEMLTQRTPFAAEYEQAIAYGILNEEPEPVTALRSGLPTEIDRVLSRALAKDPAERYQHADDLVVDLRKLARPAKSSASAAVPPAAVGVERPPEGPSGPVNTGRPIWRKALPWALGMGFAALLLVGVVNREPPQTIPYLRFAIQPAGSVSEAAISPDGRSVAYVAESDGVMDLFVQDFEADEPRRLEVESDYIYSLPGLLTASEFS